MIRLVLACLDRFRGIFRFLGVDYQVLRAILEVKLKIDARRRPPSSGSGRERRLPNFLALSLLFYAFLGAFAGLSLLTVEPLLASLTIVHGFIMLFVSMSLITDFSSVILDQTDNAVLLPRPVPPRTLLFARIVHVALYVSLIATSLGLGTMVVGTFAVGWWFPLAFAVTLAASVCLCLCIVNVVYLSAIRLSDEERLRDLILYFQIAMAVLFLSSYQLLPRLMAAARHGGIALEERWWAYLFPPCWLAAPVDLLAGGRGEGRILLAGLAFVVPVASLALIARVLAPGFAAALSRLERSRSAPATGGQSASDSRSRATRWAARLCRSPRERAAFELTWRLCSRDRSFKLRTYPTAAFVIVLPLLFYSSSQVTSGLGFDRLLEIRAHLLLLYVCCSLVPTSIMHLRVSDQSPASWIYDVVPLERPGEVLVAALKGVLLRLVLPAFALVSAVAFALLGPAIAADVALAFSVLLLASALQAWSFGRSLPFSQPFDVLRSFERVTRSVGLTLLPGLLGYVHFAVLTTSARALGAAFVLLAPTALLLRAYARTDWRHLAR